MDCKDLMIGDFVYVARGYDKHLTIEKVKGIIADKDEPYPITISTSETVSLNDIKPIPLTDEILVKNGFKKQEDVNEWSYYKSKDGKGQYMILWSMDYNYLEIGSYTDEFGEFNRLGTMRYVHQLQHALRLCGIEKELTI